MKVFMSALVIAGGFIVMVPTQASAAWTCHASSRTGSYGWAVNRSLRVAQRRALWECARRTPRGYTCYIRRCR